MALVAHRALDVVADGLLRWLEVDRGASFEMVACERPSEGLSSETVLANVRDAKTGLIETIVVRLPPLGEGAFPTYDLAVQETAQNLAAAHGLPVPPAEYIEDDRWLGSPFLVMPAVAGHVPAAIPIHDTWITDASTRQQHQMYVGFIEHLAAVHQIEPDDTIDVPRRDLASDLSYWLHYLDWCADGERVVPALDDALAWCIEHRPDDQPPPTLLWGDVRLGNVIFDDVHMPAALLDWEMTTIGAPEHDVAWWRSLEAIQDEFFGRRVEGFPSLDEALTIYEQQLGRRLVHLDWFEVFAMVRSTAVMTRLAVLNERAGKQGLFPIAENPLIPLIHRRIAAAS